MEDNILKLWMPVCKSHDGSFVGILSDTSLDRDGEFMSKELLESWSKSGSIRALANHTNKMESWVGGWRNLKTINKNGNTALVAEPWFFSKDANPLAAQIQKQVEEALEQGLNPGISIGAISHESMEKEIDGKKHRMFTKGELLEATWVPIQSNRNASFGHLAKQFDLDFTNKNLKKENTMVEEIIKQESEELVQSVEELVEEPVVEAVVESPSEEVSVEPAAEESGADSELKKQFDNLAKQNTELQDKIKKLESLSILKGTIDGPVVEKQVASEPLTVENMVKNYLGVK